MFNIRLKYLFIVLFLLISLTFTFGCSSKPSEETIKGIIMGIESPSATSSNFEEFKITKKFKAEANNEKFYCIEVNYKIKKVYIQKDGKQLEFGVKGNRERFKFVERGKKWSGSKGWVN